MIIDSSAVLAFLRDEQGHEIVAKYLRNSFISTVNFSEIISKYCSNGVSLEQARRAIDSLFAEIVTFDEEQACLTGELKMLTKKLGLSLGDCACLALAKIKNLPVLTADKAWAKLDIGVKIQLIR